jgi:hypothetical protein
MSDPWHYKPEGEGKSSDLRIMVEKSTEFTHASLWKMADSQADCDASVHEDPSGMRGCVYHIHEDGKECIDDKDEETSSDESDDF